MKKSWAKSPFFEGQGNPDGSFLFPQLSFNMNLIQSLFFVYFKVMCLSLIIDIVYCL